MTLNYRLALCCLHSCSIISLLLAVYAVYASLLARCCEQHPSIRRILPISLLGSRAPQRKQASIHAGVARRHESFKHIHLFNVRMVQRSNQLGTSRALLWFHAVGIGAHAISGRKPFQHPRAAF
jgi:hypothetical protein